MDPAGNLLATRSILLVTAEKNCKNDVLPLLDGCNSLELQRFTLHTAGSILSDGGHSYKNIWQHELVRD
jgi:hypothetical protein